MAYCRGWVLLLQELKKKELEELEALFGEFGIPVEGEGKQQQGEGGEGKKAKKKKDKKAGAGSAEGEEGAKQQEQQRSSKSPEPQQEDTQEAQDASLDPAEVSMAGWKHVPGYWFAMWQRRGREAMCTTEGGRGTGMPSACTCTRYHVCGWLGYDDDQVDACADLPSQVWGRLAGEGDLCLVFIWPSFCMAK
jgi:hypothetical protein